MPPENSNSPQGPSLPQPVTPGLQPATTPVEVVHPPEAPPTAAQSQTQPALYSPSPYPESAPAVPQLHPTNITHNDPQANEPKTPQDRYAFFLDSKAKDPTSKLALPKKGNKFAWIIIGALGLFIILGAAAVLLNAAKPSQSDGNAATFVGVINQQQEILRVTGLGAKEVQSGELANFVATAQASTTSSQQELISYVTKRGVEIDPKELAAYKADANVEKVLSSAKSASVYDSTFERVMVDVMADYQLKLQRLEAKSVSKAERDLIAKDAAKAELLRSMLVE